MATYRISSSFAKPISISFNAPVYAEFIELILSWWIFETWQYFTIKNSITREWGARSHEPWMDSRSFLSSWTSVLLLRPGLPEPKTEARATGLPGRLKQSVLTPAIWSKGVQGSYAMGEWWEEYWGDTTILTTWCFLPHTLFFSVL